jgi:hypothetical protein
MNKVDRENWRAKTAKLNAGKVLMRGCEVVDMEKNKGVVVKIIPAKPDFHGTIFVWQSERQEYGGDNCEHYAASNWREWLRIISMPTDREQNYEYV